MDDAIERDGPEQVSRRTIIKRAGVIGAAAWSAPILSTINTPAFAQNGTPVVCPDCAVCPQPLCGPGCGCVIEERTGDCFCHQGTSCADVEPCETSDDCPDGWVCANSCCLFVGCLPPCAGGAGVAGAGTSIG